MLSELLLAAAFQIGPFYQQTGDGAAAVRPFWSHEGETTDVLWPLFTAHRDWWRFCFFTHYQENDGGYQFEVMPLWWNGVYGKGKCGTWNEGESYWGLFPFWGHHPHVLLMYDIDFAFWPFWHRYRMPRPSTGEWLTSNSVCFPFVHWRSDGAWGAWPFYGVNYARESEHRYAFWPFVTWAEYRADRDTAGAGTSWMVWPFWADVSREREQQWMFLPPLFSLAKTWSAASANRGYSAPDVRLRCPWPLVEIERTASSEHTMFFPIWERSIAKSYRTGERVSRVDRFGWHLVELYDDETRVFPFWTSRPDGSYFRLWPFWESWTRKDGSRQGRFLALFPIRWVPSVDRNWAKFWTFYERDENPVCTNHSLFWGIFRWRTVND